MPNSKLKHLGEYLFDILPLTPFLPASCRVKRIQAWKIHAEKYRELVLSSKKDPGPGPGTERIDFVAGHLDILDRKFASLVTFLGLVATIATLTLNIAYNHPLICLSPWFIAFWAVWALTTVWCVIGMATLRWGDLGEDDDLSQAEEQQLEALVRLVVRRTSMFRLSPWLLLVTSLIFLKALLSPMPSNCIQSQQKDRAAVAPKDAPSRETLVTRVGPFKSGIGCATSIDLQRGMDTALSKLPPVAGLKGLHIIGRADATSLERKRGDDFGNNAGLALTRARCVAGWLTDVLGPRGIRLNMILSVQDAQDRSSPARANGSANDRYVDIYALE